MIEPLKSRNARVEIFVAADAPTLQALLLAWFGASAQRTLLEVQYGYSQGAGDPFTCLVLYTE